MIDEAAILKIGASNSTAEQFARVFTEQQWLSAARAIEQLARQEQRKNIRSVTQYGDFEVRIVFSSVRSASEFRQTFDFASGKENSNE